MWDFQKFNQAVAAIDDLGNKIQYSDLAKLETEFRSICYRKIVVVLCQNTIGSFAGYAAMINAKAVPLMLACDVESMLLSRLLDIYKPEYIWMPSGQNHELKNTTRIFEKYGYSLVKTDYTADLRIYKDLALLLTTSGSTGSPKLVRQSYQNIRANTESIVQYLELDKWERPITTLPMNYTYGLSIINTHLYVGATVLLTEKTLMQKEFWEFLKEAKATSFGGVPYTYEMLKKLRFFRMELPSIRYMTQAGGKLSPELHKEFAEYAKCSERRFVVMYGQTEATARMAYLPASKALEKYGSMGIAIPGGQFRLIDVNGATIEEPDVVGELVYEGPNVMLGYAQERCDLEKGDELEGILVTGDMAKRDADGFYYIVGRKKRFLKMFGKRVNLDEIDRLVKDQFEDLDCASTGADDKMYLFVTDESRIEVIKEYIVGLTHIHGSAIKVQYIQAIPRNDSGKTIYAELEPFCE